MLATAKNYDIICFQMRTHLPHLAAAMKQELNGLLDEIREGLSANKKVKPLLDRMIPKVFNFRIKAVKWLAEEGKADLSSRMDEIYPQLEHLRLNPQLEILAENILFAVRSNQRVVKALIGSIRVSEEKIEPNAMDLPAITYSQFLATLAYGVPDDEVAQKIVNWVNASLYIEFIIISAIMINEEKLKVSEKIIKELSFLIADAAQEYAAIAIDLGMLKPRSNADALLADPVDQAFVKEQKYLADLGINDFAENF